MRGPLRAALAGLAAIVDAGPPELADLRSAVRLVMSDVPAAAFGAALTAELTKQAPGIDLIFHPWHVGDEVERLERGEVDLVVTVASLAGASLRTQPLGTYPYTIVMRRDHPAAAAAIFDLDCWLAYPMWSFPVVAIGRGRSMRRWPGSGVNDASPLSRPPFCTPSRCWVTPTCWLRSQRA